MVGCIRAWDLRKSESDEHMGWPVAEVPDDIAHFHLGDRFHGGRPLVVSVLTLLLRSFR
jgi:hypothetical protein